jgi:hypothetical protein
VAAGTEGEPGPGRRNTGQRRAPRIALVAALESSASIVYPTARESRQSRDYRLPAETGMSGGPGTESGQRKRPRHAYVTAPDHPLGRGLVVLCLRSLARGPMRNGVTDPGAPPYRAFRARRCGSAPSRDREPTIGLPATDARLSWVQRFAPRPNDPVD